MERADSTAAAVAGVSHGAVLAVGGEDDRTLPWALVDGIRLARVHDLHVVCRESALASRALRTLVAAGAVARVTCARGGDGPRTDLPESITVRRLTEADLAERLEAADAGITAFYFPVEEGIEGSGPGGTPGAGADGEGGPPADTPDVTYGGAEYRREKALRCDVALIQALRADPAGNLVLGAGAAGIEARMAKAGGLTLVQAGALADSRLHTSEIDVSGIHVNRVLASPA